MISEIVTGFATTFKHIFRKPITVNYPDQKVPMFPKYRGKQVLMRDENGLEKCVACGLCAVACPADAIYLEAAENDGSVQAGPRYAQGLPDPQDALHLLRLLRRGVPGVGDLHGQGLRARRLQQQGLHLGQAGPARPGAGGVGAGGAACRSASTTASRRTALSRSSLPRRARRRVSWSATARWGRCSTRRASSSTDPSTS